MSQVTPSNRAATDRQGAVPAPSVAALEIRTLRFRYPESDADAPAPGVAIASLSLAPGEQLLLTGGSGSGKSTLLHLIAGLLDPNEGTVRVAGHDMHASRGARRDRFRGQRIGMIFQTFHLLPGFTAVENVMLALLFSGAPASEHRPRATAVLNELGIERTDRPVERLSVGQQQRVAVARAIVCAPALVLADEPTASLDPQAAATAMDLVQETCRRVGAALLCTSHDPAMPARFARHRSMDELATNPAAGRA